MCIAAGVSTVTSSMFLQTECLQTYEHPLALLMQVWELDVRDTKNLVWKRVPCNGSIPGYRIHCSAAVVDNKWILHGGRRPGKFNVTSQTWYLDFNTMRYGYLIVFLLLSLFG